jgi:hypothetical protein
VHILNIGHTDHSRVPRNGWLAWGDRNAVLQNSSETLGIADSVREILILSQKVRHGIAARATFCMVLMHVVGASVRDAEVRNDGGRNSATWEGTVLRDLTSLPARKMLAVRFHAAVRVLLLTQLPSLPARV